ncbi:hypothetical protein FKM82_030884 [Ascaphus truei]
MKAAVILLMLGAFLIHADALQCRKSVCLNDSMCTHSAETCGSRLDHCILLMRYHPKFILLRGCATESVCLQMKISEPSSRCCTSDLCN